MVRIDDWMGNDMMCGEEREEEGGVVMAVGHEWEEGEEGKESKAVRVQFLASPPQVTEQLAQAISRQKPFQAHQQQAGNMHIFKLNQMHTYAGSIDTENRPNGLGKVYKEDGMMQMGFFQHSEPVGQHYLFMPDGSFYLGAIEGHSIQQGIYKGKNFTFNGQFQQYEFHRKGSEHHRDYDFEGEYEDGRRVKGVLKWRENNFTNAYWGSFNIFGEFQGEGKLKTREGVYRGSFKNGLKEGKGIFQFANGLTYQGGYSNGQRSGKGRIINSNQSICYEGDFMDGLPHGWGKSWDEKGSIWEGQFKCGIAAAYYDSIIPINPSNDRLP